MGAGATKQLSEALATKDQNELRKAFDLYDKDHGGTLQGKELEAFAADIHKMCRKYWEARLDSDEEAQYELDLLGKDPKQFTLDVLAEADRNNDMELSWNEFRSYVMSKSKNLAVAQKKEKPKPKPKKKGGDDSPFYKDTGTSGTNPL